MLTLPHPDANGVISFRDGSKIGRREFRGSIHYVASWGPKPGARNGAMLRGSVDGRGDDDSISRFVSAEDAAAALAAAGEGPACPGYP